MPAIKLFDPVVPVERLQPIVQRLQSPKYDPEREVLEGWAEGFEDRDGKFVHEFQTTFESSFWELYLHAALRTLGMDLELGHYAPDFVVRAPTPFTMEATVSRPAASDAAWSGPGPAPLPVDLNAFNNAATLRLCNSLQSKIRLYRQSYKKHAHVADQPFVIAVAPFDRDYAHLTTNRPIMAALYGRYWDEEATIRSGSVSVIQYDVNAAMKSEQVQVPLGLFDNDEYKDISAVVFSPVATWGKLRALAKSSSNLLFHSFHPSREGLEPEARKTPKSSYQEHLLDGLYVFHNPFAERPLAPDVFDHDRVAQFVHEGDAMVMRAPDDFLLLRFLIAMPEPS